MKRLIFIFGILLLLTNQVEAADVKESALPAITSMTGTDKIRVLHGTTSNVISYTDFLLESAIGRTTTTWGDGTGPVVWTFGVTGTDPTLTATSSLLKTNSVIEAAGFQATKSSGVAGSASLYEAAGTETAAAGRAGPLDINGAASYQGQYANAGPASGNMVEVWAAASSGDGANGTPFIHAVSFVDLDNYAPLNSPSFTTPTLGVATGTSLALTGNLTGLAIPVVITHASGVHDGDNDVATVMTDSGEAFTASEFIGMAIYNVTDGSSGTITANSTTTITATLAGGTGNDWDTNDVWQIGPGPAQSGSVFYVSLASTIRHPVTKGYVAAYYVDGAVVLTVEVADAMTIVGATAAAVDAGDTIDSPNTAGSFVVLHNKSATSANAWEKNGTWVDGGAS